MNIQNTDKDKDKDKDSVVIKLESLRKEYDIILAQYEEAKKTYINNLQSPPSEYTTLPGRTWWGTGGLKEGPSNTAEECENMCASDMRCSGATFNPVKHYCWTRTGESPLSPGDESDNAIIKTLKANNIVLQSLNDRLTFISNRINNVIANAEPEVNELYKNKSEQQTKLNTKYQELVDEKAQLLSEIEEYNTINETISDNELVVNQENGIMRFWIIITLIVLIIIVKQLFGLENSMSAIVWFFIILLIIVLTYSLKTPSGFFIWGVALLAVIFTRS